MRKRTELEKSWRCFSGILSFDLLLEVALRIPKSHIRLNSGECWGAGTTLASHRNRLAAKHLSSNNYVAAWASGRLTLIGSEGFKAPSDRRVCTAEEAAKKIMLLLPLATALKARPERSPILNICSPQTCSVGFDYIYLITNLAGTAI